MTHPDHDRTPPPDPADAPSNAPLETPFDAALDDDLRALIAEAAALPTLRPTRDLWPGIAARLDHAARHPRESGDRRRSTDDAPADARVLPFHPAPAARGTPHASRTRWPLAAAAVALVAASSGATYLLTRAGTPRTIVASTTGPVSTAAGRDAAPDLPPPPRPDVTDVTPAPAPSDAPAGAPSERLARAERRGGPGSGIGRLTARAIDPAADALVPGAVDYDREIAGLRAVVAERRGELDSATVDVLVRNLRIIDAAIAASRAALARDPHSAFLGEQLTRALGQKVELLRTVALLPRT